MKIQLIAFLALFLLMGFVSAEVQTLPTAKVNTCIDLPQSYANSTFQNVTNIQYPDKTILQINAQMTNNGHGFFNYTFCSATQTGYYIVNGIGDVDGSLTTWQYQFEITQTGNSSALTIVIILLSLSGFLLIIYVWTNENVLGIISGMVQLLVGVYLMIFGIGTVADDFTRSAAVVLIGLGALFTISGAWNWAQLDDYSEVEGDE